jgi:hypothetical protein
MRQEFAAEGQLAYYDAAIQRARDDGYQGLRVIADVTALATDPARRAELIRWEHLADEYIARGIGFSAMCTYSSNLPGEALAAAGSVHPAVHAPDAQAPDALAPFRIFFDEGRLVLAGSVDSFNAATLASVLACGPVAPEGVVLDANLLEFLDVAGCRALGRWVRDERTGPVTVNGASPLFRRMWRLMGLDDTSPVTFAGSSA